MAADEPRAGLVEVNDPTERRRVRELFADVGQWRAMIDSACEDGLGSLLVDDPDAPRAGVLFFGGLVIYAGDPDAPAAGRIVTAFPVQPLVLGWSDAWSRLIREAHEPAVSVATRYLLRDETLDHAALGEAALASRTVEPDRDQIVQLADSLGWEHQFHHYRDLDAFRRRGNCRVLVDEGTIVAGASSFVDSQRWVECQVTVSPGYRRRGYGTRVAASYVHACVRDGKRVPWDASGTASVRLAKRIGYREVREYPVLSVLPFPD